MHLMSGEMIQVKLLHDNLSHLSRTSHNLSVYSYFETGWAVVNVADIAVLAHLQVEGPQKIRRRVTSVKFDLCFTLRTLA